jgi:D-alanine-D-alanine ligase
MRIGLVYDLFDDYPWEAGDPADADAENEPPETVDVLVAAIRRLGHTPVRIGTAYDLLIELPDLRID